MFSFASWISKEFMIGCGFAVEIGNRSANIGEALRNGVSKLIVSIILIEILINMQRCSHVDAAT